MTTFAITGATGFLGRQVVAALRARGVRLRLIGRGSAPPGADASEWRSTDDLFGASSDTLRGLLDGCDTLVHLAWHVDPADYLSSPRNLDCLRGTLNLAQACAAASVRRFVGVGSCFEYQLDAGPADVETRLAPVTLYGASKAAAYLSLSRYFAGSAVEFAWCRVFYLYGEGEDPRRFVPYLRAQLAAGKPAELGSGTQVRDFLDVRLAGEQIATIAACGVCGAVNVCSGRGTSIREMAEGIADEYGRRDLLHFGARAANTADPATVIGVQGNARREIPA
jgi:dTDP-6-deoxy-L-talose 4-dehydrogenase (NAD+)